MPIKLLDAQTGHPILTDAETPGAALLACISLINERTGDMTFIVETTNNGPTMTYVVYDRLACPVVTFTV